jgi:SOS response regulatory protein OraA/RecX
MADGPDAVETALRALRFRDRTTAELDARLEQRGVGEAEREKALETLERIGYVDDERFARSRAERLAVRGSGDALIRDDLERRGVAAETVESVLAGIEPERERVARIVLQRGPGVKTARYLAARGFGEEAVEGIVAQGD